MSKADVETDRRAPKPPRLAFKRGAGRHSASEPLQRAQEPDPLLGLWPEGRKPGENDERGILAHPSVDRGIQLLREGAPILDADELPAVAAGNPIVACDAPEPARLHDFDSFAAHFEAPPDWSVRVEGDNLDKVGFRSGDVLAVQRNPDPRDGDIVVARIGEEVVVKRFCRKSRDTIERQPESHNPEHKAIRITPHTVGFEVVGTVVGAIVGTRRDAPD